MDGFFKLIIGDFFTHGSCALFENTNTSQFTSSL
jgi:hypothetical protein